MLYSSLQEAFAFLFSGASAIHTGRKSAYLGVRNKKAIRRRGKGARSRGKDTVSLISTAQREGGGARDRSAAFSQAVICEQRSRLCIRHDFLIRLRISIFAFTLNRIRSAERTGGEINDRLRKKMHATVTFTVSQINRERQREILLFER